jgi:hypothetical protein
MGVKIKIKHNKSIETNSLKQLRLRRSLKAGTALEIKPDGLYAEQKPGSGSGGYPDGYRSNNGIESGITSPSNYNPTSKRIVSPAITHRIFTCESDDGHDISLRECDLILPGDMYRVLDEENNTYKYYLILKTNGTSVTAHSSVVATVPSDSPIN